MAQRVALNVNGRAVEIGVDDPDMPLLHALRNDLGLHRPRGRPGRAVPHHAAVLAYRGAEERHPRGARPPPDGPHPVQRAFIGEADRFIAVEADSQARVPLRSSTESDDGRGARVRCF
jgi:nicotinate dehydrogenase subunit A